MADAVMAGKRLAVLGAGKIGTILLEGLLQHGIFPKESVTATVQHENRAAALAQRLDIAATTDNVEAARKANIIVLGVKPQTVRKVLSEISSVLTPEHIVISVAASVPTSYMEKAIMGDVPVLRAMPNTPMAVGCGMTAICAGKHATPAHLQIARKIFDTVGRTVVVDEKHMDAVTGLAASGPAFIYIILESLAEAGVKVGLPRDIATLLAAQMTLGASKMVLDTGHHPALLKDAVTTPAGCTIDGILELEEGGLRVTLIKAVVKASRRAEELLFTDTSA